jgi:precorrin-6B methylase 2
MADRTKQTIEYIKKNVRQFSFKVSKIYEPEVVQYLESQPNINEYLMQLVKADMEKQKAST